MAVDLYVTLTFVSLMGVFIATWINEFEMMQILWTCTTAFLVWWVIEDHILNGISAYSIGPAFLVVFFAVFLNRLANEPCNG